MTISTIAQTITAYAGDVPDKGTMTAAEFDVAAEDWVDYQDGLALELNTLVGEINDVGADINQAVIDIEDDLAAIDTALAGAAFAGEWDDLTGALNVPASVYHDELFWMLLDDLADVTASEPSGANADWALIPMGASITDKTANYSVTAADGRLGFKVLTNEGAAGAIEFDLPSRTGSFRCGFMVTEEQYLRVNPPAGETIAYIGAQVTAADGYIRTNVPGTFFEIIGSPTVAYRVVNLTPGASLSVDA
jgi:hypothetical protein